MQYDWSGVRARRRRRLKLAMYILGAAVAVTAPVFILPGSDFTPLAEAVANLGMSKPR